VDRHLYDRDLTLQQRAKRQRLRIRSVLLDLNLFTANISGQPTHLTRLEFELLHYLVRNENRIISQQELVEQVLGASYQAESSLIRVHVSALRKKLRQASVAIQTRRGRGYRFDRQRLAVPSKKSP
jgi:DNA-binding response OmpR family regulator